MRLGVGTPTLSSMAAVAFTVNAMVPLPADEAYRRMCDWDDHARWVPFTKVTTHSPDRFTAWTGIGRLQLEDNMTVVERDDDQRYVKVHKTGPRLLGEASFTIVPFGVRRSQVQWVESVEVPRLPRILAPVARVMGRLGFRTALRRFAR
jgi:hypothetical protein